MLDWSLKIRGPKKQIMSFGIGSNNNNKQKDPTLRQKCQI